MKQKFEGPGISKQHNSITFKSEEALTGSIPLRTSEESSQLVDTLELDDGEIALVDNFISTEAGGNLTKNCYFQSNETENFYQHCNKEYVKGSLTTTFRLCRIESSNSSRRYSERTRNISASSLDHSCTCNQSSTSSSPNTDFSLLSNIDDLENDPFSDYRNEEEIESTQKQNCCFHSCESETSGNNMGCASSSSRATITSMETSKYDHSNQDSSLLLWSVNHKDVAASASNTELLEAQRLNPTDVTKGLEERWIRSHFSLQMVPSSDSRAKRTQNSGSCSSGILTGTGENGSLYKTKPVNCTGDSVQLLDTTMPAKIEKGIGILHFNDVYEISERPTDPVGGAARFAAKVKSQIEKMTKRLGERPLVVFGGDCLNPSLLSCATQGRHMIEILNYIEVDVAVFGNHEFDFGVEHAANCIEKMQSTWFLGNVTDKLTNRNLGEGKTKLLIERNNGFKIGILGLVEEEWLDTLATVDRNNLDYHDYVTRGRKVAKELREEGADFVIALTHMRWPNDIRLVQEVPDIDLVLGGHDHGYGVKEIDECLIIKSGTDFRNFSSMDIFVRHDGFVDVNLTRHDVTSDAPKDKGMEQIVNRYTEALEQSLETRIGIIETPLDGRFDSVRSQETTLGNFVADIMASVTKADIVLINSGTFRSDAIFEHGEFRLRDLMTILPINDTIVIIVANGKQLLEALENGVSKLPRWEGRFLHVSGMCFGFDPDANPGHRVVRETVRIGGKPLDLNTSYRVATKAYVARGRDGFKSLRDCEILTDPDSGPLLSTVVRNHIMNVYRLIDFEKTRSCKISISKNGHNIESNKNDIDVTEAFQEGNLEDPIYTLQKSLKPIIDPNNNMKYNELDTRPTSGMHRTLHIPNFIPTHLFQQYQCKENDIVGQHIAQLRRAAISWNQENSRLLEERYQKPHEVKWQVLPLLEARIFHLIIMTFSGV